MKDKSIYIFELILLTFIIVFKFVFIDILPDYYGIVNAVFWLGSLFVLNKIWGIRKVKSLEKNNALELTLIITMLYFLGTYLSGLVLGFLRNSYSLTLSSMFNNTYYLIIMIISEEMIRSMVANRSGIKRTPMIILTVLYIVLDILLIYNYNSVNSGLKLFIFVCNGCLPIIGRNVLASYLTIHVGYEPGLLYRLVISIYIYLLPIIPDLGYYISSVLGILVPYIIYLVVSRMLNEFKRKRVSSLKRNFWYVNVPLIVVLLFVVALVSGLFRYQIMAIGSGSMEPIYYRGDAVIFEKYKGQEKENINVGEILVFNHNGKYITHRVVDKYYDEDKNLVYQTKGDNNKTNDNFVIYQENVIGVVKLRIKFIGLPTLWFQELIS